MLVMIKNENENHQKFIKLFRKLPKELVDVIFSYYYKKQNPNLLKDIGGYCLYKIYIDYLHKKIWLTYSSENDDERKKWLLNSIVSYANNYQGTSIGYDNFFYKIFFRNPFLNTKQKVETYAKQLEKENIDKQINIYWGLFTNEDRTDIVFNYLSFYTDVTLETIENVIDELYVVEQTHNID
jgi:hypothetical protein